jgi:hypothetical protein
MEAIAPMVVLVTLILTIGFLQIAKPIVGPLVRLLETMVREREGLPPDDLRRIEHLLQNVDGRLSRLEERQSFYEALGEGQPRAGELARHSARTEE